jgi:V8-like Glu-specific endopeptidase
MAEVAKRLSRQPLGVQSEGKMPVLLTPSERLSYSTVRIECQKPDNVISIGTGFIFGYKAENNQIIPILITNKHVIDNAISGIIQFTKADEDGNPLIGNYERVVIPNFNNGWVKHPDNSVDLCAIPVGPFLNQALAAGRKYFIQMLDESLLPNDALKQELSAMEEIVMIGYPIGIWDSKNNLPIFRRGITATHPNIDYEGKKEFLIDCACYPGSSGSPILLYNTGSYVSRDGATVIGTRISLLGILYAGPQLSIEGRIEIKPIPTEFDRTIISRIPINLGYAIKSERIMDLRALIVH